jgi:RNA polymerase sigma-70 factor, ECF subfamily
MTDISATMTGSECLERLLVRMAVKDESAFEKLYSATKRKIFATVLLIVKRRHLAEEVVQEAYVRIWLNAASYRPLMGSPMNWMITIARNLAIDTVRRPVWEIQSEDSVFLNFPADSPTALDILEDQDTALNHRLNVLYALQVLDPTRRHIVIAAYIRGESRKQISDRHGVPVSTIKTWIRRALLETRASLQSAVVAAS